MNFRLSVPILVYFCASTTLCMEQKAGQLTVDTRTQENHEDTLSTLAQYAPVPPNTVPAQELIGLHALSLAEHSQQTPANQKYLLVELRNVAFEMNFPRNMNPILESIAACFTTPQEAEKSFFRELKDLDTEKAEPNLSAYYPPVVQKWLTNTYTTEQVDQKILAQKPRYQPIMTSPFYFKAHMAFTPGQPAQALSPHIPTIDLLKLCTAHLILCADFNSHEYALLQQKYPATLGAQGIFPPEHTVISGNCGTLTSQDAFFAAIRQTKCHNSSPETIFFIANNPEASAAAQRAGITQSVQYNCKNAAALTELRRLLAEHSMLPQKR